MPREALSGDGPKEAAADEYDVVEPDQSFLVKSEPDAGNDHDRKHERIGECDDSSVLRTENVEAEKQGK